MTTRWYAWVFTAIRVVMGAFFLQEAEHQIASGYFGGDGLHARLTKGIDTPSRPTTTSSSTSS
jgi:hypothetical protein